MRSRLRFILGKLLFCFSLICLGVSSIYAQEVSPAVEYYLVPQTVFVGDRGRLVAALGNEFANARAFVSTTPETMIDGERPDLVITRIELEKRNGVPRLLVDFIPYSPGEILFPSILIPGDSASGAAAPHLGEALVVKGISVTIASILEPHDMSLAAPASPLAAPGTGLFIYFAAGLVIVFLVLGSGGAVWSRRNFAFFSQRFRRRRLLRAMERLIKKLRAECLSRYGNGAELFSLLSGEFREFLSYYTDVDCRAMTPSEFLGLNLSSSGAVKGDFLSALFRRWEVIRFGGSEISRENFISVLDELRAFVVLLGNAERAEKNRAPEAKQVSGEDAPAEAEQITEAI